MANDAVVLDNAELETDQNRLDYRSIKGKIYKFHTFSMHININRIIKHQFIHAF